MQSGMNIHWMQRRQCAKEGKSLLLMHDESATDELLKSQKKKQVGVRLPSPLLVHAVSCAH